MKEKEKETDKKLIKKLQISPEVQDIAQIAIKNWYYQHAYIHVIMPDFYQMAEQLECIKQYPKYAMDFA